MSGKLYIIATPIGNLEDITLRALRILQDDPDVEVVAINNLTFDPEQHAYLYKYDSAHRTLHTKIGYDEQNLIVKGKKIRLLSEAEPINLPFNAGITKPIALAAPVELGTILTAAALALLKSPFLCGPSKTIWSPVYAWTVVMIPDKIGA